MDRDSRLFVYLSETDLIEIISNTTGRLLYAAPGMRLSVAKKVVSKARQLDKAMIVVNLDVSEFVVRAGYGEIDAVNYLNDAGIMINQIPDLRLAMLISDDRGFCFTPNAALLESPGRSHNGFNAIRLNSAQITEAMLKFSEASRAIAKASGNGTGVPPDAIDEIAAPHRPLHSKQVTEIQDSLKTAPPRPFDIARQVAVYSPYIQYVEIHMQGASLHRHKLKIPASLLETGEAGANLDGKLQATFDLIRELNVKSSARLERELHRIREAFAPSFGRLHGRVILKANRARFEAVLAGFRCKVLYYSDKAAEEIKEGLDNSLKPVVEYYLPIIKADPPPAVRVNNDLPIADEVLRVWILAELKTALPSLENMLTKISVTTHYKDVTYTALNDRRFISQLKEHFPAVKWDKPMEEFAAAKGDQLTAEK